jgi:hypothetical protein
MKTLQNKKYQPHLLFTTMMIIAFFITNCSRIDEVNSLNREDQEVEIALPLINTELSVNDLINDESENNVALSVDDQDRVTITYKGDVVRQDVTAVFPPVPFFPTPLLDTVNDVPVPFASDQRVDRAIFSETEMIFRFNSQFEEDVNVKVTIPQLTKDGEIFEKDFLVKYEGISPVDFISDSVSILGWTLVDDDKKIKIDYDARTADGERQKFNSAAILFFNLGFDYVEGYFGSEIFDINGDFVAIGVLDTWRSGGLAFEDPKVKVFVENSFGFPVRSIFNTMQVVTTTGEMLDMESEVIDNNVDFAYPGLDEMGEVKITEFSFTKENSNIVDLFKEKVRRVTYDIDAGANPDMDETITGFVNEDSYFLVSVDVELPLNGSVNNLVLQDTIDLDLDIDELDDANSAEFKNVITNEFPADINIQGYFFTEDGTLLDSLFQDRLFIPGASVDAITGISNGGEEVATFEDFSSTQLQNIKKTKKMLVNVKINTGQVSEDPLWILSEYGIKFKVGAKVKTNF